MGRDKDTLLRKFHQARWDEQIVSEMSVPGERGVLVRKAEDAVADEIGDGVSAIPAGLRRQEAPGLPEINQVRVLRHFLHLSQETMGTDVTIDISQGTCTMKYSPKVQEHIAARDPGMTAIHPLQPEESMQGLLEIIYNLERFLKEISGLEHFTFQPGGGAQGVSLINTIKSVVGVDIDNFVPLPSVGRRATSGGFCGAAVKPIALHMISQLSTDDQFNLPISGIGGITNWRDAVEFILLGSSSVQVCTEVMLRGYRIIEDMVEGLEDYMSSHGFEKLDDFIGKAVPAYGDWGELDMNYESVAKIDADSCIGCHVCVVACEDGAHQCIHPDPTSETRVPTVDEDECVGCNLCQIVCPVPDCISMVEVDNSYAPVTWNEHVQDGKPIRPKKGVHP